MLPAIDSEVLKKHGITLGQVLVLHSYPKQTSYGDFLICWPQKNNQTRPQVDDADDNYQLFIRMYHRFVVCGCANHPTYAALCLFDYDLTRLLLSGPKTST
jgi:hypothetical protein